MVSRIGLNSVWTPALVGMAALLGPSTNLVFDRLYVFCCFPMEGSPIDGKAYSQGVCYLGCSWSSVGTARFAFLTFSTDQARDGQRYGAFWSSCGMVCVCVCVCDCFRPVIFNDHEVTNFLDENIFPFILLWLFSIPASWDRWS